jgi:hypothetical protein
MNLRGNAAIPHRYWCRDRERIGAKSLALGLNQHRGATLSGSRNTGSERNVYDKRLQGMSARGHVLSARLRKILLDTRLGSARKTSLRYKSLIPAFHCTRSTRFGILPCSFLLDFRIGGRIPLYYLWVMECAPIRVCFRHQCPLPEIACLTWICLFPCSPRLRPKY